MKNELTVLRFRNLLRLKCFAAFAAAAGILAGSLAFGGVTFELRSYRYDENGYVFYSPLVTNATGPAPTQGYYLITSPKQPTSGSWRLLRLNGGDFETIDGAEFGSSSFANLMDEITNGFWKLSITNSTSTNVYQFRVGVGTILSNSMPLVQITFPQNNANFLTNQPVFTWTGPASWASTIDVFDLWRANENANWDYVTGSTLPGTQTSWPSPIQLPNGQNYFNVTYRTNSTTFFTTSVPTNNASQSLSGWAINSFTESFKDTYFSVGQPANSFDQFLVGRYDFENPGSPGNDSSGNANHSNCSGNSGTSPINDVASTNSAVGTYARQFFGDTWLCITDGSTAFANLSNALSGSFSVSAWVKTTETVGADDDDALWGMAVLYSDDFGGNHAHPISITGSKAAFSIYDNNNNPTTIHSASVVNDGSYHLITVTRHRSSGLMQLYVDGQLEASTTGPTTTLIAATYFDIAAGNNQFTGLLDDLRIYSTNLTAGDVSALFGTPPATPLSDALDGAGLVWTTGGDASWFAQTTNTHDSIDAAQSGAIGDDKSSWIQTTVTGPGTISFWWNINSDDSLSYDHAEFSVDGNYDSEIAGDWGWDFRELHLAPGVHTLRWTYFKDFESAAGLDAALLDQVSFVPDVPPTITLQPLDQTNTPGYTAMLLADAASTPESDWQWYKVGTGAIIGANQQFYAVTNSGTAAVAGSYFAIASNGAGSANTRTAVVSFVSAPITADWTKAFQTQLTGNFDNPRTNYGIATLLDGSGNIYSANSFSGTNFFTTNTFVSGPGRFAAGLFKHAADGTALWGRAITNTGNGNSYPQCVAKAPGDGVYMSGVFLGTNQIGTNVLQAALDASRLYIVRFDSAGNVIWVRTFGGTNSQFQTYHQLVSDAAGNVTISALGNQFVSFGTTNLVLNGQRGIVAQYDANGNLRWVMQPSGWVQYMTYQAGRIYAAFGGGETNFIGGLTNTSNRKFALASLNATNGQALWLQGIGSDLLAPNPDGISETPALAVSGSDLYVTGLGTGSNATFGALSTSWNTNYRSYLARLDTNGVAQMVTNYGAANTWIWAAAADSAGNVYVSGDFDGYAQFGNKLIGGPRLGSIGGNSPSQSFVAKFDRNGNSLWVKQALAEVQTSFANVRDLVAAPDGVWACGFVNYYAYFGTNSANRVFGPVTIIGSPFGFIHYWVGGYLAKVTESSIVAPPLALTLINPQSAGVNFQFQFQSQSGYTHAVQYRTNLAGGQNWQTFSNVIGDGNLKTIPVPKTLFSPAQQGFIRISTQ